MKRLTAAHLILGLAFLLPVFTGPAFALTPSEVFEKVKDSVLVVKTLDAQDKPKAQGSGVMLPSGKVATNCHVVRNGEHFQVGRGEKFIPATLYAADSDKDMCLLEVNGLSAKPVQLGKAAALKVGEAVYAVGSPRGLELSLSDGIVSQLRGVSPPIIQTTAAISPGSSGGGLFDAEGRLVGITTFYFEGGQSLNFAVPVEWLVDIQPGKKQIIQKRSQTDWLARAVVLESIEDWPALQKWCQEWSRSESHNPYAWFGLGNAYGHMNRNDEAVRAFREALRLKQDYAEVWGNLGLVYNGLKRYNEAVRAFREALRLEPNNAEAWYNMGITYYRMRRYDEAIRANQKALSLKPDYAEAWGNLAISYAISGNRRAALETVKELRKYDSAKADELTNLIQRDTPLR